MKTISNILCVLVAVSGLLLAQGKPEVGFVRIVNAISPGAGNASFLLDGRNIHARGYALGQSTGGYGVKTGVLDIEVRKPGVESGRTQVRINVGETMSVIAFAERIPPKKKDDPPRWVVKLLRLTQGDVERGFGISLISVCNEEEIAVDLAILDKDKVERALAKRMAVTKVNLGGDRSEVFVRIGDRTLTTISPDAPGNYVVILYQNAGGGTEALSYYDPRFVAAG